MWAGTSPPAGPGHEVTSSGTFECERVYLHSFMPYWRLKGGQNSGTGAGIPTTQSSMEQTSHNLEYLDIHTHQILTVCAKLRSLDPFMQNDRQNVLSDYMQLVYLK